MDKKECVKHAVKLLIESLTKSDNYIINMNLQYAVEWIVDALTKEVK